MNVFSKTSFRSLKVVCYNVRTLQINYLKLNARLHFVRLTTPFQETGSEKGTLRVG